MFSKAVSLVDPAMQPWLWHHLEWNYVELMRANRQQQAMCETDFCKFAILGALRGWDCRKAVPSKRTNAHAFTCIALASSNPKFVMISTAPAIHGIRICLLQLCDASVLIDGPGSVLWSKQILHGVPY